MLKQIELQHFQSSKDCYVSVVTEDNYIHMSWEIDDGKILSFEFIPDNYPAGSYLVWNNKKEYEEEISNIDWIQNNRDGRCI